MMHAPPTLRQSSAHNRSRDQQYLFIKSCGATQMASDCPSPTPSEAVRPQAHAHFSDATAHTPATSHIFSSPAHPAGWGASSRHCSPTPAAQATQLCVSRTTRQLPRRLHRPAVATSRLTDSRSTATAAPACSRSHSPLSPRQPLAYHTPLCSPSPRSGHSTRLQLHA